MKRRRSFDWFSVGLVLLLLFIANQYGDVIAKILISR